ncbi:MAG: S8 family serine peptidase, partial [Planctomycetota bacterium]
MKVHKYAFILLGAFLLTLIIQVPQSHAQQKQRGDEPKTEVEKLRDLSISSRAKLAAGRGEEYRALLLDTTHPQAFLNNNPFIELMFFDQKGRPIFYGTGNLDAADTISTDEVWPGGSGGYFLTGSGIDFLGIWDAGSVLSTHQELTGRVTQIDFPSSTDAHATHVAGTLIASGVIAAAKGMAFQADLDAYDWDDVETELASSAIGGMLVSNHSWGIVAGWEILGGEWYWFAPTDVSAVEDFRYGFYSEYTQTWDQIAANAPEYTLVKCAMNNRDDTGPGAGGGHWVWDTSDWVWSTVTRDPDGGTSGYDTIPTISTAKNIITVGAVADIAGGWTAS